jgi:hypothetical protein
MKVAIMQPYFFPYIGYFQMINAVDKFVFYDDVNYIKRGWINRNKILVNGKDALITVPLIKASQNKLINEIDLSFDDRQKNKMLSTIELAYKKAPFFNQVIGVIEKSVNSNKTTIGDYAANTVITMCNYLMIDTEFDFSSKLTPESKGMDKADRLIYITKNLGANQYINAIGGQELYNKDYFANNDLDLKFIKPLGVDYPQFNASFIPWLSIIDVLMFNSPSKVRQLLSLYKLS